MPATLIGNDHAVAVDFAEAATGPVVCKTLSSLVLGDEAGTPLITYTTRVAVHDIDPDAFAATSHCLQSWVGGAFDFGITGDGQWLAYECNPGAQWLWLEHQTNIGISSALAELLTAGIIG